MDDKDTIVQLAKMLAEATKDAEVWKGLYNSLLHATDSSQKVGDSF